MLSFTVIFNVKNSVTKRIYTFEAKILLKNGNFLRMNIFVSKLRKIENTFFHKIWHCQYSPLYMSNNKLVSMPNQRLNKIFDIFERFSPISKNKVRKSSSAWNFNIIIESVAHKTGFCEI